MVFSYESWKARNAAPQGLQEQAGSQATQGDTAPLAPTAAPASAGGFQNPATEGLWKGWNAWQSGQPKWLSGGNIASTQNGWNTDFVKRFWDSYWGSEEKPVDDQTRHNYWDTPTATGVVLADQGQHKFGDIYDNGKKQGNVYDAYDEVTADLMMSQLVLSAQEQAAAKDPQSLHHAIQNRNKENSEQIAAVTTRLQYESDVASRKQDWGGDEGAQDDVTSAAAGAIGGAVTGAGVGATVGAVAGGVGAVPGALIGGLIGLLSGGASAWWNRDQLFDAAARASVQQDYAQDDGGFLANKAAGMAGWGRYAMLSISPLSNATNAAFDEWGAGADSAAGDGTVHTAWEGGGLWKTGQLAAGFGDSLLQFGGGSGRIAYTVAMAASAGGKAGTLATVGTFDEARGQFDRPDTASQWMAATADVGIDVVQMGMGRALGRGAALNEGTQSAGVLGRVNDFIDKATPRFLRPGAGTRREELGDGRSFLLRMNADGTETAIRSRPTIAILAPSELAGWANTRVRALQLAAREEGPGTKVTVDHLYRAALQHQSATLPRALLVNAFGEGAEEAVQTAAEAYSHGWQASADEIASAWLQGAVMGAGMTVGARMGRGTTNDPDALGKNATLNLAAINAQRLSEGIQPLTPQEFKALSRSERRQLVTAANLDAKVARQAVEQVAQDYATTKVENEAFVTRNLAAATALSESEAAKLNTHTEAAYRLVGNPDFSVRPDAVTTSANTLERMLGEYKRKGLELRAQDDSPTTPEMRALATAQLRQLDEFMRQATPLLDQVRDENIPVDQRRQAANRLNQGLQRAFDGYDPSAPESDTSALARAITLDMSRDPNDNPGSFQLLVPQVSLDLTRWGGDGAVQVADEILQGLAADFDGDMMTNRVRFDPTPEQFLQLRTGSQYLGLGKSTESGREGVVQIAELPVEVVMYRDLSNQLASPNSALAAAAQTYRDATVGRLKREYAAFPELAPLFDQWATELTNGNPNPRKWLLDALTTTPAVSDALLAMGRTAFQYTNEAGQQVTIPAATNHYLRISSILKQGLAAWQAQAAGARRDPYHQSMSVVSRRQERDGYKRNLPKQAPTKGLTMMTWLTGSDVFRMFQKLHYTVYRAAITAAEWRERVPEDTIKEFYSLLNGKQVTPTLENVQGVDPVTTAALEKARQVQAAYAAEGQRLSILQVLSLAVPNVRRSATEPDGYTFQDGAISLGQLLLRDAADGFEYRAQADEAIAAKLSMYRDASRDQAIYELLEATPMAELLPGSQSFLFGMNMTLGQVVHQYARMGSLNRRAAKAELTGPTTPEYVKDVAGGMPEGYDGGYNPEDLTGGNVSDFAILADVMFAEGNALVTFDPGAAGQGKDRARNSLKGRQQKQSVRTHEAFLSAHAAIRRGLLALENQLKNSSASFQLRRTEDGWDLDDLNVVLRRYPDALAVPLANLLPDEVVNLVLTPLGGNQVEVANWFLNLLNLSGEEAAMSLLRNTLLQKVNAQLVKQDDRPHSDDRLVDLLIRLNASGRADLVRAFRNELFRATDVDQFIFWVNSNLVGNEAPITAWARDASPIRDVVDGWTKLDPTQQQREAILDLKNRAERWESSVTYSVQDDRDDVVLANRLLDAARRRAQGLPFTDSPALQRIDVVLRRAANQLTVQGPRAMMQALYGNAVMFYDSAADKGQTPLPFAYDGEAQMREDTAMWGMPLEQLIGDVLGYDMADVASNPQVLQQGELTLMDDQGYTTTSTPVSTERFLELWSQGDPGAIALLKAMVFPTAFEMSGQEGAVSQQFLVKPTLTSLLNSDFDLRILQGNTTHDKMIHLTQVEAEGRKFTDGRPARKSFNTQVVQRLLSDILAVKAVSTKGGSAFSAKRTTDESAVRLAEFLRLVGRASDETLTQALEAVKAASKNATLARMSGTLDPEDQALWRVAAEAMVRDAADTAATEEQRIALLDRWNQLLDGADFQQIASAYQVRWGTQTERTDKRSLRDFVLAHRTLLARVPAAANEIEAVLNAAVDINGNPKPLSVNPAVDKEIWTTVSAAATAYAIDTTTTVTGSGLFTPLLPGGKKSDMLKYYSMDYSFIWDEVLDPSAVLVQASRAVQQRFGPDSRVAAATGDNGATTTAADLVRAWEHLMPPDQIGPWSSDMATMAITGQDRINAAAAAAQVARSGASPMKYLALGRWTKRTNMLPTDEHMTTFTLSEGSQLARIVNTDKSFHWYAVEPDAKRDMGAGPRKMSELQGRFVRSVMLRYVDGNGDPQVLDLTKDTTTQSVAGGAPLDPSFRLFGMDQLTQVLSTQRMRTLLADVADVKVDIEFVDPAKQTAEYVNNVYFEGGLAVGHADNYESIISGMFLMPGGLNSQQQQMALQAAKKGAQALVNATKIDKTEANKALAQWPTDLYTAIDDVVTKIMATPAGDAKLDSVFRPAVFAMVKNMILVRTVTETTGEPVVEILNANQVIERQRAGQQIPQAEIVTLTDKAFRTMAGEQGRYATLFAPVRPVVTDPSKLEVAGAALNQDQLRERLPGLFDLERQANVFDSPLTRRSSMQVAQIVGEFTDYVTLDRVQQREVQWDQLRTPVRVSRQNANDEIRNGWREQLSTILDKVRQANRGAPPEVTSVLEAAGMPLTPRTDVSGAHFTTTVDAAVRWVQQQADLSNGTMRAWLVKFTGAPNREKGLLVGADGILADLGDHQSNSHRAAPSDLVVLDTISLESNIPDRERETRLEAAVDAAASRGMLVGIISPSASSDDKAFIAARLKEHNYVAVKDAEGLWRPKSPREFEETQMELARASQLMRTDEVSSLNSVVTILEAESNITENTAILLDAAAQNQRDVLLSRDLLPTVQFAGFGPPQGKADEQVVDKLVTFLDSPEGLAYLVRLSEASLNHASRNDAENQQAKTLTEEQLKDLADARDRMVLQHTQGGGIYAQVRPVQPGDIFPLIKRHTRNGQPQVILVRNGYEQITTADGLDAQFDVSRMPQPALPSRPGHAPRPALPGDPGNVAIYSPRVAPGATTRQGMITGWDATKGRGLSFNVRVPLNGLVNKLVSELDGFKLITAPTGDTRYRKPPMALIDGVQVDAVAARSDAMSKESFRNTTINARELIGFLGLDLMPVFQRVLGGSPAYVNEVLTSVVRTRGRGVSPATTLSRMDPDQLILAANSGRFTLAVDLLNAMDGSTGTPWMSSLMSGNPLSVDQKILVGALTYLQTEGAAVEHVLGANGLGRPAPGDHVTSIKPPAMFTQIFDNDPELTRWLLDRMNEKLNFDNDADAGFFFDENWNLTMRYAAGVDADGSVVAPHDVRGWLKFAEMYPSGDNYALSMYSEERKRNDPLSTQRTSVALGATGVELFQNTELKKTQRYLSREGALDLADPDAAGGILFRLANQENEGDVPRSRRWNVPTRKELDALRLNQAAMRQTRVPLDPEGWPSKADSNGKDWRALIDDASMTLIRAVGLPASARPLADFWVRQYLGAPAATKGSSSEIDHLSADRVLDALQVMTWNVENGYLPTAGGLIPTMHVDDLRAIFRANDRENPVFLPRSNGDVMDTWDQWVEAVLSLAGGAYSRMDPLFMTANDGLMNTYTVERNLGNLPVSMDTLRNLSLWDPEHDDIVVSMSDVTAAELKKVMVMDASAVTLDQLYTGQQRASASYAQQPLNSAIRLHQNKINAWRKKADVPAVQTTLDLEKNSYGKRFVTHDLPGSAFTRGLTQFSAMMRLANPLLWSFAPMETTFRSTVTDVRRILMGQSSLVPNSSFSKETAELLRQTGATILASGSELRARLNEDIFYLQHPGAGKLERAIATGARAMSRMQDVAFFTANKSTGRRFLEALAAALMRDPDFDGDLDSVFLKMQQDPMWAYKNLKPEVMGEVTNTMSEMRGLTSTVPSAAIRLFVDPLSNNPSWLVNVPSTLFLKIPMLFQGFYFNVARAMTGSQTVNAFAALALQGNTSGKRAGNLVRILSGKPRDTDTSELGVNWVEDTLESLDFVETMISSGISHTALMGFGLLAGNLGLGGGDEEERRRRIAARAEGYAWLYDPTDIANDFRNAQAIFLDDVPDWLPGAQMLKAMTQADPGTSLSGEARSLANLHWTLKTFISPVAGIARYLDSGNPMNIIWGFEDALGNLPIQRVYNWESTAAISQELLANAQAAEATGDPEMLPESFGFMMQMVAMLEQNLAENAFINTLYQAFDEYDRDPYTLPELTGTGEIMKNDIGVPQPAQVLGDIVGEDGTVQQGYLGREWNSAQLHALTEKRFTLAAITSLFTGGSTWRMNMLPTTRTIKKEEATAEDTAEIMLSLWDDVNQQEVLTADGAAAVFQGLYAGTVHAGDASLDGVYVPFEMRQEVAMAMYSKLIQDGVDAGLDESKAKTWAGKVFYGNSMPMDYVSLNDIIWSSDYVGYTQSDKYYQLNTTYVIGPDGRPWATGFQRDALLNFFGLETLTPPTGLGTGQDSRANTTDEVRGLNTGMRALVKVGTDWENPSEEDILAAIEAVEDAVKSGSYTPTTYPDYGNSYGYGGYGRRGYGGGGGYSSSGGLPNYGGAWQRLNTPRGIDSPYALSGRDTFPSSPILRRATLRRERFSSERGRLFQWQ